MENYSTDLVKAIIRSMVSIDNTDIPIDSNNKDIIESFNKIYDHPPFEKTLKETLKLRGNAVDELKREIKKLPKRAIKQEESTENFLNEYSNTENSSNEGYVSSATLVSK